MAAAGLVRREQGKGTFVADQRVQFGPRREFVPAVAEVADRLQVDEGVMLYRLRLAEEDAALSRVPAGPPALGGERISAVGG